MRVVRVLRDREAPMRISVRSRQSQQSLQAKVAPVRQVAGGGGPLEAGDSGLPLLGVDRFHKGGGRGLLLAAWTPGDHGPVGRTQTSGGGPSGDDTYR